MLIGGATLPMPTDLRVLDMGLFCCTRVVCSAVGRHLPIAPRSKVVWWPITRIICSCGYLYEKTAIVCCSTGFTPAKVLCSRYRHFPLESLANIDASKSQSSAWITRLDMGCRICLTETIWPLEKVSLPRPALTLPGVVSLHLEWPCWV